MEEIAYCVIIILNKVVIIVVVVLVDKPNFYFDGLPWGTLKFL